MNMIVRYENYLSFCDAYIGNSLIGDHEQETSNKQKK